MSVYLGVDFHARTQTVCWCDQADGLVHLRTLDHEHDDVRGFYTQFAVPAIVGLEATGYARWFHRLLESLGHRLLVGDAYVIRKCALRRQKNDRRDAELLLDLLLHGDFPAVHIPPMASQAVLRLLRYRQRLVEIQTKLRNGLQALALNHQLRLGPKLWSKQGQQELLALELDDTDVLQREHSLELLGQIRARVRAIEKDLTLRADQDARVRLLRTHPGVGLLTSLAVVHTLEPVTRFDRAPAYRRLLWPRSTRDFQRRQRSHGPHLQARKPAAPASAGGSGASGCSQQSRRGPAQLLFSVDRKKKERRRGHHCRGAQTGAAALPHAQRKHRLHRVPAPRS
jgi:transposase